MTVFNALPVPEDTPSSHLNKFVGQELDCIFYKSPRYTNHVAVGKSASQREKIAKKIAQGIARNSVRFSQALSGVPDYATYIRLSVTRTHKAISKKCPFLLIDGQGTPWHHPVKVRYEGRLIIEARQTTEEGTVHEASLKLSDGFIIMVKWLQ